MALRKLEIIVPESVWERLCRVEAKTGVRKEDLLMRSLVRVLEEFER